jgi:hypothetical protein
MRTTSPSSALRSSRRSQRRESQLWSVRACCTQAGVRALTLWSQVCWQVEYHSWISKKSGWRKEYDQPSRHQALCVTVTSVPNMASAEGKRAWRPAAPRGATRPSPVHGCCGSRPGITLRAWRPIHAPDSTFRSTAVCSMLAAAHCLSHSDCDKVHVRL